MCNIKNIYLKGGIKIFTDKLIANAIKTKNHSVIGLDPRIDYLPDYLQKEVNTTDFKSVADAFFEFNKKLIDATYDVAPAVKPQVAFYEQFGVSGFECFVKTCEYAREKGMLVIGDVKRGDIGSTAEAYSEFYLGGGSAACATDSITVNPYLGTDSLDPFAKDCIENGKGIFILVKTSNKSSGDIQDLVSGEKKIYEHVADLVIKIGSKQIGERGYSFAGAVVGATYKEEAKLLRQQMKNIYFLVPGYGTQGGTADDAAESFNSDGLGAIVNSSRGIIAAWKSEKYKNTFSDKDFDAAARQATIDMRDDINGALKRAGKLAF